MWKIGRKGYGERKVENGSDVEEGVRERSVGGRNGRYYEGKGTVLR